MGLPTAIRGRVSKAGESVDLRRSAQGVPILYEILVATVDHTNRSEKVRRVEFTPFASAITQYQAWPQEPAGRLCCLHTSGLNAARHHARGEQDLMVAMPVRAMILNMTPPAAFGRDRRHQTLKYSLTVSARQRSSR